MNKREQKFISIVWEYFNLHGRHVLPWRKTKNPYRILVSELMLQQTQVERVVPKYKAFIKRFPTLKQVAAASIGDVLRLWQGLGYNRRAKYLHETAQIIVTQYGGVFPRNRKELEALPGVGHYTAGAILAFSYNQPAVLIETNIRQVYLHHFFKNVDRVADAEIVPLIEKTMSVERAREWYWALMDYGSYLKRTQGNITHKSKQYVVQSKFAGSNRQIRGAIVRMLLEGGAYTSAEILESLSSIDSGRVASQLAQLTAEHLVQYDEHYYRIV
jgi:A/G-specific adenine glycosylase